MTKRPARGRKKNDLRLAAAGSLDRALGMDLTAVAGSDARVGRTQTPLGLFDRPRPVSDVPHCSESPFVHWGVSGRPALTRFWPAVVVRATDQPGGLRPVHAVRCFTPALVQHPTRA